MNNYDAWRTGYSDAYQEDPRIECLKSYEKVDGQFPEWKWDSNADDAYVEYMKTQAEIDITDYGFILTLDEFKETFSYKEYLDELEDKFSFY